jgi:hypothetical protein
MDGVISSLLIAYLLLPLALSSSDDKQNFLPGNSTKVIQSSVVAKINSKTSSTPKLIPHKIKDKSYEKNNKNTFSQLNKKMKKWLKTKKETFDVENMVIISDTPTPMIDQPFPTNGSIPEDGCDSSSVRFDDGKCYPLMGRQPCGDPTLYVTVDPKTFKVCKFKMVRCVT